tara:strand:- start:9179 stop:11074 length:1896 start_codon:yes stop_codon:yes gene_type:complete
MKYNKLNKLKQYWGFNEFRQLQGEIIDEILSKQDVLALLPTGGGKSICYQLPALMMEGVCLVISPLIALMQDQVNILKNKGIKAELINSTLNLRDIDRILDNCIYGNIKLLYLSPERIQTPLFKERFKKMKISFIAVDEAHCISQWGNDFRPNYKNISILKDWKPNLKFIALTATATTIVANDIQEQLKFEKNNLLKKSFLRDNIHYSVINCIDKSYVLNNVIKKESTIIYVRSRKKAEHISTFLNGNGHKADYYHAGLKPQRRSTIQNSWINDEFDIIVATNAFGMGIDKPNVRTVIHYELPESIEAFYQESGRGGRDGKTAYSVLLKESSDDQHLIDKIKSKQPSLTATKRVFQHFCNYYQIPIGYSSASKYEVDFDLIAEKTKLSKHKVYYVFKQLIKENYIKENYADNYYSKIKFNCTIEGINHFLSNHPRFVKLVDVLMRSYAEILYDNVPIYETKIAQRLNTSQNFVIESLRELSKLEIVNYQPKNKSYQIQFCNPRPDINQLHISKNTLQNQENELKKALSITQFSKNIFCCRNKILLSYFGEVYDKSCNKCDNCSKNINSKSQSYKIIVNALKIILKYEAKSAIEIYREFEDVLERKILQKTLKKLLHDEIIFVDKNNLIKFN